MKKLNMNRLGIGLFCTLLIGGGSLTLCTGAKEIAKATVSGAKAGYTGGGISGLLTGTISGIENGVASNLFAKNQFINLYGLTASTFGNTFIRDADTAYNIVKDNNGDLQFIANERDDSKAAEAIVSLNETLCAKDIPLLYVQAPLKYTEGFTEFPAAITDYSNSNTDKFKGLLEAGGVDVLDLRDAVEEDHLDKSSLFYNTDHHWRTETAFWAVGKTVETLKEGYGIDLDPEGTYTSMSSYRQRFFEQSFLGSQGRRVGKYFGGIDDFTLITPNFETNYTVTINKSDGSRVREGSFEEAIIDKSLLEEKDVFTNRYASYFGADYPEVVIQNHSADNDYKVLVVKDSYALPYTAFLSTMVGEVCMLDLRYYSDMSIEQYVETHDIDAVLYVYKSINTVK